MGWIRTSKGLDRDYPKFSERVRSTLQVLVLKAELHDGSEVVGA